MNGAQICVSRRLNHLSNSFSETFRSLFRSILPMTVLHSALDILLLKLVSNNWKKLRRCLLFLLFTCQTVRICLANWRASLLEETCDFTANEYMLTCLQCYLLLFSFFAKTASRLARQIFRIFSQSVRLSSTEERRASLFLSVRLKNFLDSEPSITPSLLASNWAKNCWY